MFYFAKLKTNYKIQKKNKSNFAVFYSLVKWIFMQDFN